MAQKDRETIVKRAPWVDVVFGTHNIGSPAGAARPGPAQQARRGRDPRVARDLPVDAADPPRLRLRRLGVDLGRLQQHLHVLHRAEPARQGAGPPARATSSPRSRRSSPRASSRSPCSGRTSTPTASSSATGSRSASCCAPAARSRASSGCASPARTRPPSPTTSSPRWPRPRTSCRACTCRCSRAPTGCSRRCAAPTAARSSSASSTRSAPPSPTPRSPPTSSSASPARPRRTSQQTLEVVRRPRASPAPSPSSTPSAPGTPAATMPDQVPKAVVQERYERLIELQERISWAENRALEGREVEVLVATGRGPQGRRDRTACPAAPATTAWCTSPCPRAPSVPRPGDVVTVGVTYGAPHHLVADAALSGGAVCRAPHRRWRRVGRRCRTHPCRASPPCPWGCPRWADPRPSPSRPRPAARGSRLERDCRLEGVQRGFAGLSSPCRSRRAVPERGSCSGRLSAMAVRPIVITGEPVLHQRALPVESFDGDLRALVADMFETMDAAHGVGLAAPQIGVGLRIFTWQMENDGRRARARRHRQPVVTPSKPAAGGPGPRRGGRGLPVRAGRELPPQAR